MSIECPNFDNYLTTEPDLGEPCFDCKSFAPERDGLCGDCIEERLIQADIEECASERDEAERAQ